MQKPNNYDNTQAYGEFTPLELGGHILVIKKVEETKSQAGRDMIKILLDTAQEDRQPGYYQKQFADDIRPEKKWGCIVYQLVLDNDGNTNRGLKTFHTCVEKSNVGFEVKWGDKYADCFTGKKIGGVFGKEEYLNARNEKKAATKCFFFRSVDTIKEGVDIPDPRLLPEPQHQSAPYSPDGFMSIADSVDQELPFN